MAMTAPSLTLVRDVLEAIDHAAKMRGMSMAEVGRRSHFTDRTWARRKKAGEELTLREMTVLAEVLGLSVPDLLAGAPHVTAKIRAERGEPLPHLDSNQEPSDYPFHTSVAA